MSIPLKVATPVIEVPLLEKKLSKFLISRNFIALALVNMIALKSLKSLRLYSTGSIFKSGIPVGTVDLKDENEKILINFYSDFTQLKYVFAEIDELVPTSVETKQNDQKEEKNIV